MNATESFYAQLVRPEWAPPSWIFGPVWTVLYILIAISFLSVFNKMRTGHIPKSVALPFALNIIFNIAYSPIQFGLQNIQLAAVDIILVLATLVWALIAIYKYAKWITYINIPYLLWVSFATYLQLTIVYLN